MGLLLIKPAQVLLSYTGSYSWVLAEEFGRIGGRWHCHALVAGVAQLERSFWWREGYRRFGRTRIEPCKSEFAASHYAAKYEAKQLGEIHFGGTLAGVNLSKSLASTLPCPGGFFSIGAGTSKVFPHRATVTLPSADLPKGFFHFGLRHWHR
jgi:hypothetical protein